MRLNLSDSAKQLAALLILPLTALVIVAAAAHSEPFQPSKNCPIGGSVAEALTQVQHDNPGSATKLYKGHEARRIADGIFADGGPEVPSATSMFVVTKDGADVSVVLYADPKGCLVEGVFGKADAVRKIVNPGQPS